MYFRLTAIDGRALPCRTIVAEYEYDVLGGGLLLEPAERSEHGNEGPDSHSILKLFGEATPDDGDGLIVASMEPYRRGANGHISISRHASEFGARFRGVIQDAIVQLWAEPGRGFLPPGTHLTLEAAPADPITAAWANTFNFGPPMFQPIEPWRQADPVVRSEIDRAIAAAEPERLRRVRERLERAWRAPA